MQKNIAKLIFIGLIAIVILVFIFKSYVIVEPGERGIIFNKLSGNLRVTSAEGFYLLIPIIESVVIYDIKVQSYTMAKAFLEGEVKGDDSLLALTSDGQQVSLDVTVRYHPDPEKLINLHRRIGRDYIQKIVRPQVRSEARLTVSNYPVMDVYSGKRENIQNQIEEKLKKSFAENFIILDEVLLRDVRFSTEFQQAIEQKQIAQQEAERMKYVLEREEREKQRKIIEAEGEAEAIKLKGKALGQNPALIQYEYVQKVAPNVQAIISDGRSILSLGEFLRPPASSAKKEKE
ncbi:MAG: prohibitin family protein [Acidobacteriota bacterium]